MKVKICGLRRPADVECVNSNLPDYAGFILAPGRRRTVTKGAARELKGALDRRIHAVGVFVDAPIAEPMAYCQEGIIDLIQLHGHENPDYIRELKRLCDAPVIKAFVIQGEGDLKAAASSPADILLLDGGRGDGRTFDWAMLSDFPRPYLLAGGLSPANVEDAIATCHPWGIDVSSGVETDGFKDPEKVRRFVELCHNSEA